MGLFCPPLFLYNSEVSRQNLSYNQLMQALEPAYLLHAIPYRNTSLLASFFTLNHGLVQAVVRGARGEKSKLRGVVQSFSSLEISWYGKGELVTIQKIEPAGITRSLSGDAVFYGLYLNELMLRLWRHRLPDEDLYYAYEAILKTLHVNGTSERPLRVFEKKLLRALGYDLQLTLEYQTGLLVEAKNWYRFSPDRGAERIENAHTHQDLFSGASLLALEQEQLESPEHLSDAKRITRSALARLLGDRPLKSRELFAYSL
jgi:DNA repair protein RecO (recombination protein O)